MDLTLLPILLLANPSLITPLHTYHALTGRPSLADCFLLCLGMQIPLSPTALNEGEYPACAAMTTGYCFRVENQATVMYLQRTGLTGHLVTLEVSSPLQNSKAPRNKIRNIARQGLLYLLPTTMLLSCVCGLVLFRGGSRHQLLYSPSPFSIASISLLLLSRFLSILTFRARTTPLSSSSWHGQSEPGVKGDLLILLSEDRWIRMKGLVDDLKAVTSGSWLLSRPGPPTYLTILCETMDGIAGLLVYIAAIVLVNAPNQDKIIIVLYALLGQGALAIHNATSSELVMNDRRLNVSSQAGSGVKKYPRRLVMARELVKEMGRSDFAVRLGMLNPDDMDMDSGGKLKNEIVTM
ncbi:hypothetical protein LTR99_008222 [Exophiala xenobiotica]|uniref:Uncharacterized protein n=1 Tax=Vermiconidia calcicola TaxID=1690605 RepID=A0AAV9PUZ6_9PEZI|nr:hypothetical protein LTR99_008222 [Exophiala xenobiotica]KAK5426035.1 hypothetical protein LTR34_010513 [Exophiala xenobiotica]KAK5528370.1 hypothetical protein LTR25_010369 [Vermiconidia calcicola]